MKKHVLNWLALGLLFLVACQRETSFELGTTPGTGTLQFDATGDCMPKTVSGTFIAGTALVPTASTITVSVNVLSTGTYTITTDTVNGYFFRATGTFTSLGATNIVLRSSGTPFAAGINNFVVTYGASVCDIQITVLPAGAGAATFSLTGSGTPPGCTTPVVSGTYGVGIPLNATNTVVLNVNVTAPGTYNISTTAVNGMTFNGTGTLAAGNQTITLIGTGTPATAGNSTIPIIAGVSTCNFIIAVSGPAVFTMVGSPSCTTPVISGSYAVGTPLDGTNTVTLNVMVTAAGSYSISTSPSVNGMLFTGTGSLALGAQTIVLTGVGNPTVAGNATIPITAGATTCSFVINVAAGPAVAVGTLDGGPSPAACAPFTVIGTYTAGTALTAGNTVNVQIDVTGAGTYNINTGAAVNGISFSKTGTAVVANNQTITLVGTGTPTAAGVHTFTVTFGTSTCTFTVTTVAGGGAGAFTANCLSATPDGLYEATSQLNGSNTVDIDVNVTALGAYNISTTPVNGMTFSKSGTFTTLGNTTLTLQGSGTPVAGGTFNIQMPGTVPCTFQVVVDPAPLIDWKFTVTNAPSYTYQGQTDDAQLVAGTPPAIVFGLAGSNSLGTDNFQFALNDVSGNITNGEIYTTTATAAFQYDLADGSDTYTADPSVAGVTMTFTVTTHNVATKTITGTFSGTCKNTAGQVITITNGTFKGTYP